MHYNSLNEKIGRVDDTYHNTGDLIYMLSTGFRDIHLLNVYDGDILKDDYGRILLVIWSRGGFCFKAITKTNFVYTRQVYQWFEKFTEYPEIIGNMYENPKLLKLGE